MIATDQRSPQKIPSIDYQNIYPDEILPSELESNGYPITVRASLPSQNVDSGAQGFKEHVVTIQRCQRTEKMKCMNSRGELVYIPVPYHHQILYTPVFQEYVFAKVSDLFLGKKKYDIHWVVVTAQFKHNTDLFNVGTVFELPKSSGLRQSFRKKRHYALTSYPDKKKYRLPSDIVGNFMKCGSPEIYVKRYVKDVTNMEEFPFLFKLSKHDKASRKVVEPNELLVALEKVQTEVYISSTQDAAGKLELFIFNTGLSSNLEILHSKSHIDVLDPIELDSVRSLFIDNYINSQLEVQFRCYYQKLGINRKNRQTFSSVKDTLRVDFLSNLSANQTWDTEAYLIPQEPPALPPKPAVSIKPGVHLYIEVLDDPPKKTKTISKATQDKKTKLFANTNLSISRSTNCLMSSSNTNKSQTQNTEPESAFSFAQARSVSDNWLNRENTDRVTTSSNHNDEKKGITKHKIAPNIPPKPKSRTKTYTSASTNDLGCGSSKFEKFDDDTDDEFDSTYEEKVICHDSGVYCQVADSLDSESDSGAVSVYENRERIEINHSTKQKPGINFGLLTEDSVRNEEQNVINALSNNSSEKLDDEFDRPCTPSLPDRTPDSFLLIPNSFVPISLEEKQKSLNFENCEQFAESYSKKFKDVWWKSEITLPFLSANVQEVKPHVNKPPPVSPRVKRNKQCTDTTLANNEQVTTVDINNISTPPLPQCVNNALPNINKNSYTISEATTSVRGLITAENTTEKHVCESQTSPNVVSEESKTDLKEFSVKQVIDVLALNGLKHRQSIFQNNDIDGNLLADLDKESFVEMNLTKFEACKLHAYINGWRPLQNGGNNTSIVANMTVSGLSDFLNRYKFSFLMPFMQQQNIDGYLFSELIRDGILDSLPEEHGISLKSYHLVKLKKLVLEGYVPKM